jgi:hypothetical protein
VVVPAIAGVVFTKGGRVYTIENPFHSCTSSPPSSGSGIPAVNVLQEWIGSGNDQAAQASLPRQSDLYGRAVIAPAAAVTENPITDTLSQADLVMLSNHGTSRGSAGLATMTARTAAWWTPGFLSLVARFRSQVRVSGSSAAAWPMPGRPSRSGRRGSGVQRPHQHLGERLDV